MATSPPRTPLPLKSLFPLVISRVAEGLTYAVIFPYVNEMIHSFGVPEESVGFWSGMVESSLQMAETISAPLYAPLADRVGRRPVFLLLLGLWAVGALGFGFCTYVWTAILVRGWRECERGIMTDFSRFSRWHRCLVENNGWRTVRHIKSGGRFRSLFTWIDCWDDSGVSSDQSQRSQQPCYWWLSSQPSTSASPRLFRAFRSFSLPPTCARGLNVCCSGPHTGRCLPERGEPRPAVTEA